jgi:predicted Zn-dependent protease
MAIKGATAPRLESRGTADDGPSEAARESTFCALSSAEPVCLLEAGGASPMEGFMTVELQRLGVVRKRLALGKLAISALTWVLVALIAARPVAAEAKGISLIRDAEIEHTLMVFATPILKVAGIPPEATTIALANDQEINASTFAGYTMLINTGLLTASDSPEQVIGVMAHEFGHMAGGHVARSREGMENAAMIATIATLLGMAAAIGSGRGDAAAGVIAGGQELAMRSFFAFTRSQEGSADEAGMSYMEQVGWTSRGLLQFMEKLASQELRPSSQQDEFVRSHPLTQNRIDALRDFVEHRSKHSDDPMPAEFNELHARMKAKLIGFLRPDLALRRYPESDHTIAARYARAIAKYQKGDITQAVAMVDDLIAVEPQNAYFYELKGQILFENGRAREAVQPYSMAVKLSPKSDLLQTAYAHAIVETGDDRLLDEAIAHLQESLRIEHEEMLTWQLLASAYSRKGMEPQLAYARAEEALSRGDVRAAKFHAQKAEQMLPKGSPEWIRAQDIRVLIDSHPMAMQSRGG